MTTTVEPRGSVTALILLLVALLLSSCQTQQTSSAIRLATPANDVQPLVAHSRRLIEVTHLLGVPFTPAELRALESAFQEADDAKAAEKIQRVLDARCL